MYYLKWLQIQQRITEAENQQKEQRQEHKATEQSIMNRGEASSEGLMKLLCKYSDQLNMLRKTEERVAELSKKGITVRHKHSL